MTNRTVIRLATLVGVLVALAAAVLTGSRLVEGQINIGVHGLQPIPELAAFAPWALPLWVIAGVLLLVGRQVWTSVAVFVVAGCAIALSVYWLLPPGSAKAARTGHTAASSGVPVRLMTLNADLGQADAARTLALVKQHQVDILVVEELTPELLQRLRTAGIDRLLPYSSLHPEAKAAGTGIWSHFGMTPGGTLPSAGYEMPEVNLVLPTGGNASGVGGRRLLRVTGVHAMSPIRYQIPLWRQDLSTIAETGASQDKVGWPSIYAGDFNASRDHAEFRAILNTGLVDAADAGSGVPWTTFTWPANRPGPAFTRIDHVLVTPSTIAVGKVSVVSVGGTDHHGVIAELRVSV